ncbi:hypothetical protein HO173_008053 [Letharia columbiana]|uniref:Uncharacterized protein n=1 Tax=Letharia columbiana TaxID=112416 RepID=A0A8H6FSF1_9LECA|nr:uncharacterized protein HO173_008053 [Letharia columbiana]KAF6233841.1 hypothetical protein HO173_008053 [Letharia columbiana]
MEAAAVHHRHQDQKAAEECEIEYLLSCMIILANFFAASQGHRRGIPETVRRDGRSGSQHLEDFIEQTQKWVLGWISRLGAGRSEKGKGVRLVEIPLTPSHSLTSLPTIYQTATPSDSATRPNPSNPTKPQPQSRPRNGCRTLTSGAPTPPPRPSPPPPAQSSPPTNPGRPWNPQAPDGNPPDTIITAPSDATKRAALAERKAAAYLQAQKCPSNATAPPTALVTTANQPINPAPRPKAPKADLHGPEKKGTHAQKLRKRGRPTERERKPSGPKGPRGPASSTARKGGKRR